MGSRLRPFARFLAVFAAGLITGAALTASANVYPLDRLQVFAEALVKINDFYVDERDPNELVYDAIGGLTQGLDDHSVFLDPERYLEMQEQTSGEYFGVGIQVEDRDGHVFVIEALEGSPALQAGVEAGDEIVAVDDVLVEAIGADAALARIRGDRGTVVVLTVVREGREHPLDIPVRRDRVHTRSAEGELLPDGVGLLRIERFQRRTVDEVRRELAELEEQADGPLQGLVVDLRGNPGGYLSQAVAVTDLWVEQGRIVSTVDRRSAAQHEEAHRAGTDTETPIAVLVDGGSASAAEIVAGALKDHGRATVIGYTTYGKGSVQQFFDLSDGSALKLTTARYLTPGGHNIHGSGIAPNLALGPAGARVPAHDLGSLLDAYPIPQTFWGDPALHVALAWLDDGARVEAWFAAADRGQTEPPVGPPLPVEDAPTAGVPTDGEPGH